ncbi:spore germination protein, partial [Priestia megaterium]|uniref:spore germination protein n=1 Tax=Priestia megaterium TaxID=1404 RepID=UPI00095B1ED6
MNSAWNRLMRKARKPKKMVPQYEEKEMNTNSETLTSSLAENLTKVKDSLGNSGDLVVRDFKMGKPFLCKVASVYINGLTDKEILGTSIIERMMNDVDIIEKEAPYLPSQLGTYIKEHMLTITNVGEVTNFDKLFLHLLSGETITIVLVDGWD